MEKIIQIKNVFTPEQYQMLISLILKECPKTLMINKINYPKISSKSKITKLEDLPYTDAQIYSGSAKGEILSGNRICEKLTSNSKIILEFLNKHVLPKIKKDNASFYLNIENNHFDILRYKAGGKFKPHTDFVPNKSRISKMYACLICLKGTVAGGQTKIWLNEKKPVISNFSCTNNSMVAFQSELLHEGMTVTKGEKIVLKFDIIGFSQSMDRELLDETTHNKVYNFKTNDEKIFMISEDILNKYNFEYFKGLIRLSAKIKKYYDIDIESSIFSSLYKFMMGETNFSEKEKKNLSAMLNHFSIYEHDPSQLNIIELQKSFDSHIITYNYNLVKSQIKHNKIPFMILSTYENEFGRNAFPKAREVIICFEDGTPFMIVKIPTTLTHIDRIISSMKNKKRHLMETSEYILFKNYDINTKHVVDKIKRYLFDGSRGDMNDLGLIWVKDNITNKLNTRVPAQYYDYDVTITNHNIPNIDSIDADSIDMPLTKINNQAKYMAKYANYLYKRISVMEPNLEYFAKEKTTFYVEESCNDVPDYMAPRSTYTTYIYDLKFGLFSI